MVIPVEDTVMKKKISIVTFVLPTLGSFQSIRTLAKQDNAEELEQYNKIKSNFNKFPCHLIVTPVVLWEKWQLVIIKSVTARHLLCAKMQNWSRPR